MRNSYGHSVYVAETRPSGSRPGKEGSLMRLTTGLALVAAIVVGLLSSCGTAPASREDKAALVSESASRWQQMRTAHPALDALVKRGHGYALFPDVGKAGLGVGGAYGRGVVDERGRHIGYSDLTQATVGAQVGGQSFCEVLVFEQKDELERFKRGQVDIT